MQYIHVQAKQQTKVCQPKLLLLFSTSILHNSSSKRVLPQYSPYSLFRMKHVCAAALFHVCARAAVYSSLFGSGSKPQVHREANRKWCATGASGRRRADTDTGGGGEKKKFENVFVDFFSKSRGRPSSRCRSVLSRRGCPALSRSPFRSDRKKKVKIFLSPVAGQAVDVGASWAGEAALL